MPKRYKFAIIGAGNRGLRLGLEFQKFEEIETAGIADRVKSRGEYIAAKLAATPYRDYVEMIERTRPDVVFVTTPDATHREIATRVLDMGCHCMCEKPLATNARDALAIVAAARRAGKMLEVGFVLRYVPSFAKIKELVQSGIMGAVCHFDFQDFYANGRTFFRRWNRFYSQTGGLSICKGCHSYDLLNWWTGSRPARVAAFGGRNVFVPDAAKGTLCRDCANRCSDYIDIAAGGDLTGMLGNPEKEGAPPADACLWNSEKDNFDNAAAIIEYENGARASCNECFFPTTGSRALTAIGPLGQLELSADAARLTMQLFNSEYLADKSVPRETVQYAFGSTGTKGHWGGDAVQIRSILKFLETGEGLRTSAAAAVDAVAVGEAVEKSIRERRVVEIKELLS